MELFKKETEKEYEAFVSTHPKGHFMQSVKWAGVKREWKWEAVIVRDENKKIVGTMALLIRKVPGLPTSLMYSPRGPVCDIHDEKVFKELVDGAKELAKKYKCYLLKLDPDVVIQDEEFLNISLKNGFKVNSGSKSFEAIQPRFVFRMNVHDKTMDELMASFHSKTRYNVRVAIKNNVEMKICGKEVLPDFIPIMETTGERDSFITRPLSYFENMKDCLGDDMRVYMAYYENKPIAGSICIHYGDKVWYLYGASANMHRNKMPNYLVQHEMIKWAVETGCNVYDFRGISGFVDESNPLYGIYRFKKGFNPDFTEFIGELEYICNKPLYLLVEKGQKTYRKMRRMIKFKGKSK